MTTAQKILLVALAGAIGTLARYALGGAVQRVTPASFPYGTLVVNVAGCVLFGVVWALAEERLMITPETRTILLVGFMGAFTTFSTYAFETTAFLRDGQWATGAANLLAQNLLGIAALLLGLVLGRAL
jgi:CrcB protein